MRTEQPTIAWEDWVNFAENAVGDVIWSLTTLNKPSVLYRFSSCLVEEELRSLMDALKQALSNLSPELDSHNIMCAVGVKDMEVALFANVLSEVSA